MDVRRLRLLLELARRGTITAVAEALAYTPSAVSQQFAVLEREAGVPLLERTGRRVALTPAGMILAQYAESILATLEEASAALAATRSALTGPLRVGAYPSAARTILPPALVALGREHPRLELMVSELDPAAVPGALHAGALDIAITSVYDYVPAEPDPALDAEPLLDEVVYLATTAEDAIPTIEGCRDASWIAGSPGTMCHTMLARLCQARGFTPRIRHHADDFATVLALVAAGQGVSLVPQLGASGAPPSVTLTPLKTRRHTEIAYRKGTRHHPVISAFASAIRAVI
ncbi:MAG: LysR family transcriptional regulator [Actinomycetia bacterium]|nr:LysR family transcriptional regulator [Actinomycetes bacterium]